MKSLPIDTRASIVWVNAERFMVPATLQVWNRLLTYQPENEIRRARVEIYGAVHDLLGKTVYEFEDQVYVEDTGYRPFLEQGKSLYQHTIPLKSGRYKLDWVVRDVHSGKIGTSVHSIVVPPKPGDGTLHQFADPGGSDSSPEGGQSTGALRHAVRTEGLSQPPEEYVFRPGNGSDSISRSTTSPWMLPPARRT